MANNTQKTTQAYLGTNATQILHELSNELMLSKSAVIRLALKKLYTSSIDDLNFTYNKRLEG